MTIKGLADRLTWRLDLTVGMDAAVDLTSYFTTSIKQGYRSTHAQATQ